MIYFDAPPQFESYEMQPLDGDFSAAELYTFALNGERFVVHHFMSVKAKLKQCK